MSWSLVTPPMLRSADPSLINSSDCNGINSRPYGPNELTIENLIRWEIFENCIYFVYNLKENLNIPLYLLHKLIKIIIGVEHPVRSFNMIDFLLVIC